MKFSICRLKPKGPFHLGERENWREGSAEFIHSDTLFSAFCHSYLLLYSKEELEAILARFDAGNPPFIISSAYPCWQGIYYFPVPKNQLPATKEAKKIQFIEKSGFEKLVNGIKLEDILSESQTIPAKNEPYHPWIVDNVPRVSLSRYSNHPVEDGGYFHFGLVYYRENAELFFLIKYNDLNIRKKLEAALRLMAEEGIGGDRSSGKGIMYPPVFEEIDVSIPDGADGIVSLSLYYPKDDNEINKITDGFYELIERKGYIYSPFGVSLRRKSIRMFTEGSVFPANPSKIGRLVNIKPEIFVHHNVYRYGFMFGLPCRLELK
ncbi:MAG: type III-A CRISPR-associated RAMP protein Csm4 [candidate division WOR-3 bacterium]|nr:type III-A CRISPR-associated RAMP protein Csm4 [candidate division WOR-3 bacterium]